MAWSSTQARSLVLLLNDGTEVYYTLGGEEHPSMRFVGGDVVVSTSRYAFSDIKKFFISETDEPAALLSEHIGQKDFSLSEGTVYARSDAVIKIYNLDGREMKVSRQTTGKLTTVDTRSLPQGTYLLLVGNKQMKFVKR